MSEAASQSNAPVQAEATIKAEGNVSWDQLESVDIPDDGPRKKAEKTARGPAKGEKSAPKTQTKADDVGDDDEAKPKKGVSEASKDETNGKDEKAGDEKPERKAKPKVHKIRSGENTVDLPGDGVVTVQVDGKKEEVAVQDLIDQYSGKTDWSRKYSDLGKEKEKHQKTVESMNSMINNLMSKAKDNPDEGLDFLADLVGQDPVDFKEKTLRAQIAEVMPLANMSEAERESWIKDKVRDWRDKKHDRRDLADKESKAKAQEESARADLLGRYGIDDDSYNQTARTLRDHFEKTGQKVDITPGEVIRAQRYLTVGRVIKEVAPHLESHANYDKILDDVTRQMLEHPSLSQEKVAKILQETWPATEGDKSRLRQLSEKAQRQAESSGDDLPKRKSSGASEPMFFNELD